MTDKPPVIPARQMIDPPRRRRRHADEGRHPRLAAAASGAVVDGGPSPAMTGHPGREPPVTLPSITATALFFDDIRVEVTGKMILIGQYVGDMILGGGAPPVDRLAVLLNARWPRDYVPASLRVRIEIPGSPNIEYPLPLPAPMDFSNIPVSPFSGVVTGFAIFLRFAPLRVGDMIDVWILADGTEFPAGRLRVSAQPTAPAGMAADRPIAAAF